MSNTGISMCMNIMNNLQICDTNQAILIKVRFWKQSGKRTLIYNLNKYAWPLKKKNQSKTKYALSTFWLNLEM